MDDQQLLRYSRHILLQEWGVEGQQRLADARVLVLGAGGLGSPALLYLASAGVGSLTVVDPDEVDLTNLQRQVIHTTERVGRSKVDSAALALRALNPLVKLRAVATQADAAWLAEWVPRHDLVLDCTDRFDVRQQVNAACVAARRPLVWASAVRFDAQMSVWDPLDAECPCYACLFPPDEAPAEVACATLGVFAPLVGVVGSLQAGEALKLLAGVGEPLRRRLLMLEGSRLQIDVFRVGRSAACPVCGGPPGSPRS